MKTTKTNEKIEALASYFSRVPPIGGAFRAPCASNV